MSDTVTDNYGNERECLDRNRSECEGTLEWRASITGTGTPIPRCDKHHAEALDHRDAVRKRYPDSDVAPSWFDESYAGERWNDDY